MANILITGGAGFIGRWLTKRCVEVGHSVCILDNLTVGKLENLAELEGRFVFVRADVRDTTTLARTMQQYEVHLVFHLAAIHYIPYCEAHPLETYEVNVQGTLSVLEAMRATGVSRLVFASTGALYPPLAAPLHEEICVEAHDIYGLSKQMSELAIAYYQKRYGIQPTVVRLFNTYGPYETNPHLLPHLLSVLKTGSRTVPLGNLQPKRDYIYVEDVAEGLYRLGMCEKALGVYNLGTGVEYSVQEVVNLLSELLNEPIQVVQDPARVRSVDKLHQRADTAKLRSVLGWKPQTSLREGLGRWLRFEGILK